MNPSRRDALKAAAALIVANPLSRALTAEEPVQPAITKDPALADAVSLSDFEAAARTRMSHMAWEYVMGGAGDEITLRWNREALDKLRLDPRVLRDVSQVNTEVTVLGEKWPFPVMLAPTALHRLAHREGELATARAAAAAGVTMGLSTMSSTTLEDVAKASPARRWFQLYVQHDKGFTEELVARAEAGGYRALVVTVDTPTDGARNRQERAKFHLPPGIELANLRGLKVGFGQKLDTERKVFENLLPDRLTWQDIEWLRKISKVPVILKGILNADDADIAARSGVAGIIVSNHGARNLDTVPATIDALPRITDKVAGRTLVLMDGGIRRGTDVLKALARGANGVLIGRPIFHGLATGGAEGVTKVLNILRREFEMAMALTGLKQVSEIDRKVLWE